MVTCEAHNLKRSNPCEGSIPSPVTKSLLWHTCFYSTVVVQLTCNEQVVGSNPTGSSKRKKEVLDELPFVVRHLCM